LVDDIVAVVMLYSTEKDFSKWSFAVKAARSDAFLEEAIRPPDTTNVIPIETKRRNNGRS